MPETSGYQKLGQMLGGGAGQVREQAYQEGKYRTAQTENALAQARENQLQAEAEAKKAEARARVEDDYIATGGDAKEAALLGSLVVGEGGSDFNAGMSSLKTKQEIGNRDILGDPNAPLGSQFAAGQAVQGKMLNRNEMMGAGDFMDITQPEQPLVSTPLGGSMRMENEASAALSDEKRLNPQRFLSPTAGGEEGVKPEGGFMLNPDFDPTLPEEDGNTRVIPISGGSKDPNTPGKLGVRERQVVGRVMNAGLNTANDLENIMRLPSEADTGFFGTGMAATPATTIMDATVGQLKYKISDSEVRDYQRILGGLTNQMATMELMGMAGSESIRAQYDALALRPYDTIEDKMLALALIRQTTENGLQTILSINPVPKDTRKSIESTIASMAQAVPFTVEDVINLKHGKDPTATIGGMAAARQAAAGMVTAAPVEDVSVLDDVPPDIQDLLNLYGGADGG